MGTVRRLNILCPNLVQPNVLRTGSISEFPFHCAPTNLMFWWAIMRYCHTNTISYIIVSILQISYNKLTKGEGRKMSLNPVYCTLKSWGKAGLYHWFLTHWGRDKMDFISQTTFSSAFSWMKIFEFRLKFHWSLFLRVQLTILQHRFR